MTTPARARIASAYSTTATVSSSGAATPLSTITAHRSPASSTPLEGASGTGRMRVSMPSGPRITPRISSRSATVLAIGPTWLIESVSIPGGRHSPVRGTLPLVGLMPTVPQACDGTRMLPP